MPLLLAVYGEATMRCKAFEREAPGWAIALTYLVIASLVLAYHFG